jgi:RND family efflux transporter MFP subunit
MGKRFVDFGDRVRQGQPLAEIEAPELNEQVRQARAAVSQAKQQLGQAQATPQQNRANPHLAPVTWERYRTLAVQGVVSRQEADQQATAYKAAEASVNNAQASVGAAQDNVRAARANLERLIALQQFEIVRAPFAGIVTERNLDVGALINSPGGGGSGPTGEIFRIARIDVLRVLINVPQSDAPFIRVGQSADLTVQELSGQRFTGRVTRTANALDPANRTLLTEVQVKNPTGILLPGMYARLTLVRTRPNPPVLVPGDALITGAEALRVAVYQSSEPNRPGTVQMRKVEVGRDYGPETEVTAGLSPGEFVIVNPGDAVKQGALVQGRLEGQAKP